MVYGECLWRRLGPAMSGIESIVRGRVPGFDAGGIGDRFLPEVRGGYRVDVSEDEDAIVVIADLPGFERRRSRSACSLRPTSRSRASAAPRSAKREDRPSERAFGRMNRVVPLPHAATAEGASASFTNGVLEVR